MLRSGAHGASQSGEAAKQCWSAPVDSNYGTKQGVRRARFRKGLKGMERADGVFGSERIEGVQLLGAAEVHEGDSPWDPPALVRQSPGKRQQRIVRDGQEHDCVGKRFQAPDQTRETASSRRQQRRMPRCVERRRERAAQVAAAGDEQRLGRWRAKRRWSWRVLRAPRGRGARPALCHRGFRRPSTFRPPRPSGGAAG